MAKLIRANSPMSVIPVPITLTAFQSYVGGFVKFIELSCGDLMVVNEAATELAPLNQAATDIAGRAGPIYGHAVHCSPEEIA